jgi:hypothetical protein
MRNNKYSKQPDLTERGTATLHTLREVARTLNTKHSAHSVTSGAELLHRSWSRRRCSCGHDLELSGCSNAHTSLKKLTCSLLLALLIHSAYTGVSAQECTEANVVNSGPDCPSGISCYEEEITTSYCMYSNGTCTRKIYTHESTTTIWGPEYDSYTTEITVEDCDLEEFATVCALQCPSKDGNSVSCSSHNDNMVSKLRNMLITLFGDEFVLQEQLAR